MTVRSPDEVDRIVDGDHVAMLAYVTPARGTVLLPLTNFGVRDRDAGTVTVNSSVGMWTKLAAIRGNPHVALAFHTRKHALCERPEYVLVQGRAALGAPVADYPATILENWERIEPWRGVSPIWKWWLRVYALRVAIEIRVERVIVWPDLRCNGPTSTVLRCRRSRCRLNDVPLAARDRGSTMFAPPRRRCVCHTCCSAGSVSTNFRRSSPRASQRRSRAASCATCPRHAFVPAACRPDRALVQPRRHRAGPAEAHRLVRGRDGPPRRLRATHHGRLPVPHLAHPLSPCRGRRDALGTAQRPRRGVRRYVTAAERVRDDHASSTLIASSSRCFVSGSKRTRTPATAMAQESRLVMRASALALPRASGSRSIAEWRRPFPCR